MYVFSSRDDWTNAYSSSKYVKINSYSNLRVVKNRINGATGVRGNVSIQSILSADSREGPFVVFAGQPHSVGQSSTYELAQIRHNIGVCPLGNFKVLLHGHFSQISEQNVSHFRRLRDVVVGVIFHRFGPRLPSSRPRDTLIAPILF